ncbi:MAG: PQQ-binding-like beta-propeller repeat protein [Chitinispirillaceae bacterium]|nr:PQQ-binding-like beta-propeller repeat protein [Chitinispirillaceae bacterium]
MKRFIIKSPSTPFLLIILIISATFAEIDTLWAAGDGGGDFTTSANGTGAPDGSYTYDPTNSSHTFNNFNGGAAEKGRIDSVKLMTYIYTSASQSNDNATLTPDITGVAKTITTAMWNNRVGSGNAGYEFFDITGDGIAIDNAPAGWSFSDFTATSNIVVNNVKNQGPDGGNFYYDAFAFQIFYTPSKPDLTIDTVYQSSINGTGEVTVQYDLTDLDLDACKLTIEYSYDASTWYQAYIKSASTGSVDNTGVDAGTSTGQITAIATDVSDATFVWDTPNGNNENGAFTGEDASAYIRITPNDGGQDGDLRTSGAFVVDNQAPAGYDCLTPINGTDWPGPQPTLTSVQATDLSTISYLFDIDTITSAFTGDAYQTSDWQSNDYNWTTNPLETGGYYWWRVKASDIFGNEGAFAIDTFDFQISTTRPNMVIDSVKQTSIDGTGQVTVYWDLADPQSENCKLTIEYSFDYVAWYQAHIQSSSAGAVDNTGVSGGTSAGQVTGIGTNTNNQTFVWDSDNAGNENGAFAGEDAAVWIRGVPNDGAEDGETITSSDFMLDNQAPTGYSCSSPANSATDIVLSPTLLANSATDQSTMEYYFECATDAAFTTGVQHSEWQSGVSWEPPARLNGNTTYYWHVKARDAYGNEGTYAAYFSFTTSTGWTYPASGTIGPCTGPAIGDGVVYVGTAGTDDKLYCIDITDGSLKWSTAIGADVVAVSAAYDESAGKYTVYVGYSKNVVAYWDNGSSSAVKWSRTYGNPANDPSEAIPDPVMGNAYYAYNKLGYKVSNTTGNDASGWPTASINASENSSPVIDGANVYFGTTGGNVYKYLIDGTLQGNVATSGSAINTPLGAWHGTLFAAPDDNFVYAINMSTLTLTWTSPSLGAATTTGVFSLGGYILYVGAGNDLEKITNNGASATVAGAPWPYSAGGAIYSMPITNEDGTKIFFGCDDNSAYGINTSASDLSGFPKTGSGNALHGAPVMDVINGIVVFTSLEGRVYGYTIQ